MATTPAPRMTPTALMLDTLLQREVGDGLVETVTKLRDAGLSWRQVAVKVEDYTGHRVTYETVRDWSEEWRAYAETGAA